MDHSEALAGMTDRDITATVLRERARLGAFIRSRVADPGDAEDILQDVFFAFVEACRLPEPIEQAGAWLFKVARKRYAVLHLRARLAQVADQLDF